MCEICLKYMPGVDMSKIGKFDSIQLEIPSDDFVSTYNVFGSYIGF